MKIKNSPGYKNTRRISALKRLEKFAGENPSLTELMDIETLRKRIISDDQARSIRTKKNRQS